MCMWYATNVVMVAGCVAATGLSLFFYLFIALITQCCRSLAYAYDRHPANGTRTRQMAHVSGLCVIQCATEFFCELLQTLRPYQLVFVKADVI